MIALSLFASLVLTTAALGLIGSSSEDNLSTSMVSNSEEEA
jgi:hypothetical protein